MSKWNTIERKNYLNEQLSKRKTIYALKYLHDKISKRKTVETKKCRTKILWNEKISTEEVSTSTLYAKKYLREKLFNQGIGKKSIVGDGNGRFVANKQIRGYSRTALTSKERTWRLWNWRSSSFISINGLSIELRVKTRWKVGSEVVSFLMNFFDSFLRLGKNFPSLWNRFVLEDWG